MSRAFTKEPDNPGPEPPPELKMGSLPNWVTPRGLQMIEDRIADLKHQSAAHPDAATAAWVARDLRYWTARRASAQVVDRPESSDEVTFGSRVTFRRAGREPETIEIVGEDEADPAAGRLSWVAPLASAMLGASPGETVSVERPPAELEILSVEKI